MLLMRVLAVIVVLAFAVPASGRAADPFSPLPSSPQTAPVAPTVTAPSTTSTHRSDLSSGEKAALLGGGALLLALVAFLIVRDARKSAPRRRVRPGSAPATGPRPGAPTAAPGSRGRPTGKGGAARKRRRRAR